MSKPDDMVVVFASLDTYLRHGARAVRVKVRESDTEVKEISNGRTLRFATAGIVRELQKRYNDPNVACFVS